MNTERENCGNLDCKKRFVELHDAAREVIEASTQSGYAAKLGTSYIWIPDLKKWIDIIKPGIEHKYLSIAVIEYEFSLLALAQGYYRHAFISLRLFFELSLKAILLSTNEVKLRLWDLGQYDPLWKHVIDDEDGLFSKIFIKALYPDLEDKRLEYLGLARKLYSECSDFVHGQPDEYDYRSYEIAFNENLFNRWINIAKDMRMVVCFALCVRYLQQLHPEHIQILREQIIEEIGHHKEIRLFLNTADEA